MNSAIAISMCLLGVRCRYDGSHRRHAKIDELKRKYLLIPFCPELMAGLPIPRPPAFFSGGGAEDVLLGKAKIINEKGEDLTDVFINGSKEALYMLKEIGVKDIILKDKSPACGVDRIWIDGKLVDGCGLFTFMARNEGFNIINGDRL